MRYALYTTPAPTDPFAEAAARWLGRDAFTGALFEPPAVEGLDPAIAAGLRADPVRYGFHGTMKAPFRLAEGRSEDELVAALDTFGRENAPVTVPELVVRRLGAFFAFVPNERVGALDALADRSVIAFEAFRAPLAEADIARRRSAGLTLAEEENLVRWGYPYVFDAFRYHMTLTGRVPRDAAETVERALAAWFADQIGRPFRIDRLALFVEPEAGGPFRVRHQALLEG
ncbi:DUF1045 domain-containing protein [Prosthecomicrobium pneumaticum]|uniref:Putative phosphonate metabolism protein n=1 Tax=Prosthecomicrobium pneumaticum TaxID=81895 RepID=A0A7W9FQ53_9HYPH|nr:putative phosphonate metabolism protein [Prosthecomicrobium pneumaticum]